MEMVIGEVNRGNSGVFARNAAEIAWRNSGLPVEELAGVGERFFEGEKVVGVAGDAACGGVR